jgi:protein-arginine kinase
LDESEQYKVDGVYLLASKLYDNWPYGRALYCNHDRSFVINVNNVDHLEIKAIQEKNARNPDSLCDIQKAFKILTKGVSDLS